MSLNYMKKADIQKSMKSVCDGYRKSNLLPGIMDGISTYKCELDAGKKYFLESYADSAISIFFISGIGTITANGKEFSLTERAVFCPRLEVGTFEITAETNIEFLMFIQKMSEEDFAHYNMYHIVLPWFNSFKNWHLYTEGFRNEALHSYACLHQYYVSRMSIGEVVGPGSAKLDYHKHPELFQWFYGLPGTDPFLFSTDDDAIDVEEGDWICIPNEINHIVSPKKDNDYIDYVWFEVVVPGLEMCPYFY